MEIENLWKSKAVSHLIIVAVSSYLMLLLRKNSRVFVLYSGKLKECPRSFSWSSRRATTDVRRGLSN